MNTLKNITESLFLYTPDASKKSKRAQPIPETPLNTPNNTQQEKIPKTQLIQETQRVENSQLNSSKITHAPYSKTKWHNTEFNSMSDSSQSSRYTSSKETSQSTSSQSSKTSQSKYQSSKQNSKELSQSLSQSSETIMKKSLKPLQKIAKKTFIVDNIDVIFKKRIKQNYSITLFSKNKNLIQQFKKKILEKNISNNIYFNTSSALKNQNNILVIDIKTFNREKFNNINCNKIFVG
jgi:hypothetical protein